MRSSVARVGASDSLSLHRYWGLVRSLEGSPPVPGTRLRMAAEKENGEEGEVQPGRDQGVRRQEV